MSHDPFLTQSENHISIEREKFYLLKLLSQRKIIFNYILVDLGDGASVEGYVGEARGYSG
jgi:hypothetical protein